MLQFSSASACALGPLDRSACDRRNGPVSPIFDFDASLAQGLNLGLETGRVPKQYNFARDAANLAEPLSVIPWIFLKVHRVL
jgi:hypothetical protein